MKKIGIFYWPLKGNVEKTAKAIATKLNDFDVEMKSLDIATIEDLDKQDILIFGNSTVGASHWEDSTDDNKWYLMFHQLEKVSKNFNGKKTAFFSLGDHVNYPHNFVDSLALVYEHVSAHNITHIGRWPNKGYEFYESKALQDNYFPGLVLDLDNHPENLEPFVNEWIEQLRKELI